MRRQAVSVCFASLLLLCIFQYANGRAVGNCYPNPSNSSFQIVYELTADLEITISIFDILGREVKLLYSGIQAKGVYSINWDVDDSRGKELPSGLYFYKIGGNHFSTTGKVVILK